MLMQDRNSYYRPQEEDCIIVYALHTDR